MNARRPLPQPLSTSPFTTSAAASEGVSRSRLRAADLRAPFHGTRVLLGADDELSLVERCRALHTRMHDHQLFSHLTAAQLYDLPLPRAHSNVRALHVTSLAPHPVMRRSGVTGHQLAIPDGGITTRAGLRVAEPREIWRQLGAHLAVDDLVVLGDALVLRRHPLCTFDDLVLATETGGHRPGRPRLVKALKWVRPGVDSPMESRLRLFIRDAGLPEPEVNGAIVDRYGEFVALGDLVYRDHRIVVEYDGGHHRTIEDQYHRDIDREYAIRASGWELIRINKTHLRNRAAVAVARVAGALHARVVKKAQFWRNSPAIFDKPRGSPLREGAGVAFAGGG